MKRLILLLFVFGLIACGGQKQETKAEETPVVEEAAAVVADSAGTVADTAAVVKEATQ